MINYFVSVLRKIRVRSDNIRSDNGINQWWNIVNIIVKVDGGTRKSVDVDR